MTGYFPENGCLPTIQRAQRARIERQSWRSWWVKRLISHDPHYKRPAFEAWESTTGEKWWKTVWVKEGDGRTEAWTNHRTKWGAKRAAKRFNTRPRNRGL